MPRQKAEQANEAEEPEQGESGSEPGGDSAASVDKGELRQVVREVVEAMFHDGSLRVGEGKDDHGGAGDPAPSESSQPRTAAAQEDSMASRVREEIQRLKGEEDRDNRLSGLEESLKKLTEEPPVKQRRSERIMWGRRPARRS